MGRGWNYAWYREKGGKVKEIFPESSEQKEVNRFGSFKKMITFETMSRSYSRSKILK